MSMPSLTRTLRLGTLLVLVPFVPSCTSEGWDPTANMGGPDESFIARSDGEVDIGTLGKLGKYISGQRRLGRDEEQILQGLVRRQIGGYRIERLRVLERKREATVQRHQSDTSRRETAHKARIEKIRRSPSPAPEKTRQIETAEREHKAEAQQAESNMKRELVLIDDEISREKRRTYVVPVNDPKGAGSRSIVLVDSNNRIKESKVYQIDRSVVDLAKVVAREDPEVAVLTDVPPLRLPGGS